MEISIGVHFSLSSLPFYPTWEASLLSLWLLKHFLQRRDDQPLRDFPSMCSLLPCRRDNEAKWHSMDKGDLQSSPMVAELQIQIAISVGHYLDD
jgi:hypothetical protein